MNAWNQLAGVVKVRCNRRTALFVALVGLMVVVSTTGCQTQRQLSAVQRGMTESEVRSIFGEPDEVESGVRFGNDVVVSWYYFSFATQPYREWVYVQGSREYGGTLEQVQTSRGVRYRKFKIVFLGGTVISVSELAPPEW